MKIPTRFFCVLLLLTLWLLLSPLSLSAQSEETFTLSSDSLQNGRSVDLSTLNWKYHSGDLASDDSRFTDPQFDDRSWETLKGTTITLAHMPSSGWRGIGWFRLRLRVAPELIGTPLNLEMFHLGASEIYVDGKQIARFGVVGKTRAEETAFNPNGLPFGIVFQSGSEHVLAVRYSNQLTAAPASFWSKWISAGVGFSFSGRIKRFGESVNQERPGDVYGFSYGLFQGAFSLALGILHLLLFAFLPRQRANLYYGIFLLGLAWSDFVGSLYLSTHYGVLGVYVLNLAAQAYWLAHASFLAFIYTAFNQRIPRRIWLFLALSFIKALLGVLYPGQLEIWIDTLLRIAISLECLRIMVPAIRQQLAGAWMVGVGLLFYVLAAGRNFIAAIIQDYGLWFIVMDALAWYGLMLIISVHLAREFARTNDNLEDQLAQVKQLSAAALEHEKVKAENERRAQELEEARQLQLSMLPKRVPQLPHLEIAAYMKTASEVGGDYYDFHLSEDGALTVAVGDATGHGLKAGTMVSSVKSLFLSLADHPDIPHIFHRMSSVLKSMKLRGLFMAMTIVKVNGNQLTVSISGMPPVLIYRAAKDDVEEIALRAIPLGSLSNCQYTQRELVIAPGDVIALMSDGLPERFNAENEMLDYTATRRALAVAAHLTPQEIIDHLVRVGDEWSNGRPQDDDVTFVVLKVIGNRSLEVNQ